MSNTDSVGDAVPSTTATTTEIPTSTTTFSVSTTTCTISVATTAMSSTPTTTMSSSSSSSWSSWSSWGANIGQNFVCASANLSQNFVSAGANLSQGLVSAVKEKSAQAMEVVKKDLNEFVEVIQGDTAVVLSETASKMKEGEKGENEEGVDEEEDTLDSVESATKFMKKGMADLLSSVSGFIAVPQNHNKEGCSKDGIVVPDFPSPTSNYNRKEEKLHALQIDPNTFCEEPSNAAEFAEWVTTFELHEKKQFMANLLVENPALRSIYTQLVPAVISHAMFWERYFYKVHLLDCEEKKREEIMARASGKGNSDDDDDDEGSGWGDDDDDLLHKDETLEIIDSQNVQALEVVDIEKGAGEIIDNEKDNNGCIVPASDSINVAETAAGEGDSVEVVSKDDILGDDSGDLLEQQEVISDETSQDTELDLVITPVNTEQTLVEKEDIAVEKEAVAVVKEPMNNEQSTSDSIVEIDSDKTKMSPSIDSKEDCKQHSSPTLPNLSKEFSETETSSVTSWMSIDDVIKVKKVKGEQVVPSAADGNISANVSSDSNGVMVNHSDAIDESDDDFDIDLDDVSEADVAKMVEKIKGMPQGAGGREDSLDDNGDDWESWE